MRRLLILTASLALGCGDDGSAGDGDGDGDIPELVLGGTIVDFETGEALAGGTVTVDDTLRPPPTVTVNGADFEIQPIPPFSVFHILATSPPGYRATYNRAVVDEVDVFDLEAEVLSEAYIEALIAELGVSPEAGTGVLIAQLVDEAGAPLAGVPAGAFVINNAPPVAGPFFLDDQRQPDAQLTATSASGYVVFFDLEPGLVAVEAAVGSGLTMEMAVAPADANAATVASVRVAEGEVMIPTGVSFSNDVVPVFDRRGCSICHSGNGIGRDLANLTLDGSSNLIHRELTEEISPGRGVLRVNTEVPADSLLLRFPSAEQPPDAHPNVTFTGETDPDYLTILGWITDGAPDN